MFGRSGRGVALAGSLLLLAATAACSDSEASGAPAGSGGSPSASGSVTPGDTSSTPEAAKLTVTPARNATAVRPDQPVRVSTSSGSLQSVTLTDSDGEKVTGSFDGSRATWTSAPRLKPSERYTVAGTARGGDGGTVKLSSTFRTVSANGSLRASVAPLDGETVGVAMPIQIFWNNAVTDRAAVERRLAVKTSVPVEGSWHWVNSKQVNYRPKAYWPAGTKVGVTIGTQGVNAGAGVWGASSRQIDFAIGKSVVTRIDVRRHTMTVEVDGKPARTIPVTAGKEGFTTRSGTKVIMEKYRTKRMDARTVGIQPGDPEYYDIHDVQYAQRVTSSGEFIHGAPWSSGSQGSENVSHGCIGMSLKDGAWYFSQTLRGDPVVVTGTTRRMEPGNGWTDWNQSWAAYRAGSALA